MTVAELTQSGEFATLKEHQQALYYLLCEFDRVCTELEVTYYLFAGTLLGAVRHGGFIPWDDDLDVIMCREDYERFLNQAPGLFDQKTFSLQKEFSEHYPMFFSKLQLNDTTCFERFHPKDPLLHQGVYIDVFPCDNAYPGKLGRFLQFVCSKIVVAKSLDKRGFTTHSVQKKVVMVLSRILPDMPFRRIVRGPKKMGTYVHCFFGGASKIIKSVFPAIYFQDKTYLTFEDRLFAVPKEYDAVLKVLYGDYMRLPEESERGCKKHAVIVDLKHSYTHHKARHDEMIFDASVKSIR